MLIARAGWMCCAALSLSACGHDHYDDAESRRSGASETREVGSFDAIEFDGDGRLEIVVGDATSVELMGRSSVIKRTETQVKDNTLYIEVQRKEWSWGDDRKPLTVRVSVPQLRRLELDGGNDARLSGFKGGETTINLRGAGRIRASGELDRLTVSIAGAGHADLSRLIAGDAKVTVDGVGSIYVHPKDSLDATMNGVGAILYSGSPQRVSSRMNGLGTISKRDEDGHRSRHRHREDDRDQGRHRDRSGDPDWEEASDESSESVTL